jgi:hypothetical protein
MRNLQMESVGRKYTLIVKVATLGLVKPSRRPIYFPNFSTINVCTGVDLIVNSYERIH